MSPGFSRIASSSGGICELLGKVDSSLIFHTVRFKIHHCMPEIANSPTKKLYFYPPINSCEQNSHYGSLIFFIFFLYNLYIFEKSNPFNYVKYWYGKKPYIWRVYCVLFPSIALSLYYAGDMFSPILLFKGRNKKHIL